MASLARGTGLGGPSGNAAELLVGMISEEIKVLEPQLQFANLGVKKDVPKGYDRIVFPQGNQSPVKINISYPSVQSQGSIIGTPSGGSVMGSSGSVQGGQGSTPPGFPVSSTEGVAAIVEGTNPGSVSWGLASYSAGPAQYGILYTITDLVVRNSAIEVVDNVTRQVKNALARLVDTVIQTVVNGGVNGVIYSGNRTARTGLTANDTLTSFDMRKAYSKASAANAAGLRPFSGSYYAAVIHPYAENDLFSATNTGGFADQGRYVDTQSLKDGKMGDFQGVRYMRSAYVNYFNSNVAVYPTTLVGEESFGWGYFQPPTPIITTTPDSNNPLNLYTSIAGKVTLGATRFEDTVGVSRIFRVESAASNP